MAIIVPIDMPEVCGECLYKSAYEEVCVNGRDGLYKHIARCMLQPEEIEDGYKTSTWLSHNRFPWCPLKPYREDGNDK